MSESDPTGKPGIRFSGNGPLIVSGLADLRRADGTPLQAKPRMALCRCGGSANKPYCDGTHARNGFSGENTAERSADRVDRYAGQAGEIRDNRFLCAHVGECTERLAAVFRLGQEPWIDPDGADAAAVREAVAHCPSGALAHVAEGPAQPAPQRDAAVIVSRNGPYHVQGGVELDTEHWGAGASRERYALCRCGASRNKPFCDGSHWDAGFGDDGN